jgi:putative tricarboxylic transport membrane protein
MQRKFMRHCFCSLFFALAFAFATKSAHPQWKPEKNVEFVIGTGVGGAFDRTARVLQRIWKDSGIMPATVLVLNKPGAGQSLALTYLNQYGGDGHYLTVASGIIFANQLTGRTPHAYTDFTPLAMIFNEPTVFAVHAGSGPRTGRDLLAHLKRDPTGPSFAVGSTLGSATHIASALVVKAAGGDVKKMKAVVLNSSGDSVMQVMGGHIDVVTTPAGLVLPQAQAGKLRMIAVASPQRVKGELASVPTWIEQGVNAVAINWRGILGPRGMSAEQIAYWEGVFARTAKSTEWQREMQASAWDGMYRTSRDARKFLDTEYASYRAMLADLGLIK